MWSELLLVNVSGLVISKGVIQQTDSDVFVVRLSRANQAPSDITETVACMKSQPIGPSQPLPDELLLQSSESAVAVFCKVDVGYPGDDERRPWISHL